ncbi:LLM class flavin-dependent oxidoreductase [Novosphingobium resinovorum]
MTRPVKLLWYLTAPDGPYPWAPEGRWQTGFDHLEQLARTIDKLGFYGALLGSSAYESLAVAAAMIPATERMKFLVAQHPGELSWRCWRSTRRRSTISRTGGCCSTWSTATMPPCGAGRALPA